MKTRIATYFTAVFLVTLLFPSTSFSQRSIESIDEAFEWKKESKEDICFIDVNKKSKALLMSFAGVITEGSLEVNVYNPSGEKIPGFHLLSDDNVKHGVSVSVSTGDNMKSTETVTSTNSSGVSTSTVTTSSTSTSSSVSASDSSGKYSGKSSYGYTSSSSNSQGAKGVVSKIIAGPMQGKWKLVIIAKNAVGKLDVEIDQE